MTSNTAPLVSICLPVYNAANFLPAAFDCINRQRYKNFEVIIVDDGSIDESGSLARSLLDKYSLEGTVISTPNQGCEQARDLCCKHAKGTIIAPYDADDLWGEDYLKKMVAVLLECPEVNIVYSDFSEYFESEGVSKTKSVRSPWVNLQKATQRLPGVWVFEHGEFTEMMLEGQVMFPPCTVYRRELYDAIGGYSRKLPKQKISLDWWFGIMATTLSPVAFHSESLLVKHRHSHNTSGNVIRTAQSDVHVLESLLMDNVFTKNQARVAHRRAARRAQDAAYGLWTTERQPAQARRWLTTSLKHGFDSRSVKLYLATWLPSQLTTILRRLRGHAVPQE